MRISSKLESLKDATLGASITSWLVGLHQFFYGQKVHDIIESSWWQFLTTLSNGYINLRIYDFCKQYFYSQFPDFSQRQITLLSAFISSCETWIAVYCIQEFIVHSKNAHHIAFIMQFISGFWLGYIYEKMLHLRDKKKEL